MQTHQLDFYKRLGEAIALLFGKNCEVVIHDLEAKDKNHTIVAIWNGHVSGRKVGDGPSHVVLEALHAGEHLLEDRPYYLTKTTDGKTLKSATVFIRDEEGHPTGIFAINYDITVMQAFERQLLDFIQPGESTATEEPEPIVRNVADLLDNLIEQSVELVGTPVALMTKDQKLRALDYLDSTGAFLITKSGLKVCQYFGMSKYTLYSYLDEIRTAHAEQEAAEKNTASQA